MADLPKLDVHFPLYRSHKTVEAFKIDSIIANDVDEGGFTLMAEAQEGYGVDVDNAYMKKHEPKPGGYWVRYPGDGYQSFSPAKAFEDGYTSVDAPAGDADLPINLSFAPELLTNGDLSRISVKQLDSVIRMTQEQALTLANEIQRRFAA